MNDFSRRQFLKTSGIGLMAGLLPLGLIPMAEATEHEGILFSPALLPPKDGKRQEVVCRIDLAAGDVRIVPIDFTAHSISVYPGDNMRAVVLQQWGRNIATVDFKSQTVTNTLKSVDNRDFFGHGVFSQSGDILYATQGDFSSETSGQIIALDTKTLETVGDYSFKGGPHECHLGPDNTLFVASNGLRQIPQYRKTMTKMSRAPRLAQTAIVQLSLKDGKELKRWKVDDMELSHFTLGPNGTIGTVARLWTEDNDNIYVGHIGSPELRKVPITAEQRKLIKGQLLSMTLNEKDGIFAITSPIASTVILVDIASATIKHIATGLQHAKGVAYRGSGDYFITSGPGGLMSVAVADAAVKEMPFKKLEYHHHNVFI